MISDDDRARIAAAIRDAESRTAGEILCVIARGGGDDALALIPVAWAALVALCVPLPLVLLTRWHAGWLYAAQIAVFVAVAALLSHARVRPRIVPRRTRHRRAHAEAMRQFFAHGIDKTAHRTGVLIFASEAERYVAVIADQGINDRVPKTVWDGAVATLTASLTAGRPGDGFVAAIEQCGAVLATHFPPGALARDELPDRLVEI